MWRVDKKDFLLWTISCITTLFLGIEIGVLVGVSILICGVFDLKFYAAFPYVVAFDLKLCGTRV